MKIIVISSVNGNCKIEAEYDQTQLQAAIVFSTRNVLPYGTKKMLSSQ